MSVDPKIRDALEKSFQFIGWEYGDERSMALEGEYVSKEARPVWYALSDALAVIYEEDLTK